MLDDDLTDADHDFLSRAIAGMLPLDRWLALPWTDAVALGARLVDAIRAERRTTVTAPAAVAATRFDRTWRAERGLSAVPLPFAGHDLELREELGARAAESLEPGASRSWIGAARTSAPRADDGADLWRAFVRDRLQAELTDPNGGAFLRWLGERALAGLHRLADDDPAFARALGPRLALGSPRAKGNAFDVPSVERATRAMDELLVTISRGRSRRKDGDGEEGG